MIGSKNITVSNIMSNANFGFELETVGSLGRDGAPIMSSAATTQAIGDG